MTQAERAQAFAALHVRGTPLVLYNIWDAGSARAVAGSGAKALATGSWSVAAAQGYPDRQAIPLELLLLIVGRITATVELPVTVDFEGAYAEAPEGVAENVAKLLGAGAIGINFEDQVVGGTGLYTPEAQAERIAAAHRAGADASVPLFINARTDLFLKEPDPAKHGDLIDEAKARAAIYVEAGASSFFVPGLIDIDLIAGLCKAVDLPVNIMMMKGAPSIDVLAGVASLASAMVGCRTYWP